MKSWHFDVLFIVGVGGLVYMMVTPLDVPREAVGGIGLILSYVLSRKDEIVKKGDGGRKTEKDLDKPPDKEEASES